jgi:hypothetical protein
MITMITAITILKQWKIVQENIETMKGMKHT